MKNIISILVLMFCASSAFAQSDKAAAPVIQIIPAQTLKTSPATATPTPSVVVKPVVVEGKQINGGGLVAIPTLTLANDNGTQPAVAVPEVKMPEQIKGQSKPAEIVVTPPSVINAAKTPVKQN